MSENLVTLETSKARTGQECILDCKDYEHAAGWALKKIESCRWPLEPACSSVNPLPLAKLPQTDEPDLFVTPSFEWSVR
jgi:hypothetical protein